MKHKNWIFIALIIVSVIFISAVAYHSVQEIHYLKGFFPSNFTVEQAKDASVIELVKVSLIAIPVVIIISLSLFALKKKF